MKIRPPSPEPIYNNFGARVNTREQRAKDKLLRERTNLIEEAMRLNPAFRVLIFFSFCISFHFFLLANY